MVRACARDNGAGEAAGGARARGRRRRRGPTVDESRRRASVGDDGAARARGDGREGRARADAGTSDAREGRARSRDAVRAARCPRDAPAGTTRARAVAKSANDDMLRFFRRWPRDPLASDDAYATEGDETGSSSAFGALRWMRRRFARREPLRRCGARERLAMTPAHRPVGFFTHAAAGAASSLVIAHPTGRFLQGRALFENASASWAHGRFSYEQTVVRM